MEDALDMATGNYDSSGYEVDEASDAMLNGFFLDNTDVGKTNFSCSYARKSSPGSLWVYHTTDTYLLVKAMDSILNQDSYSWLSSNLYQPLGLSPTAQTIVRTLDNEKQAVGGFGATYQRNDLIKLGELLNNHQGRSMASSYLIATWSQKLYKIRHITDYPQIVAIVDMIMDSGFGRATSN